MPTESLIIGGGPAGLAAALFLARAQRQVTLLHHGKAGAFPQEPGSTDWLQQWRQQAEEKKVEFLEEEVVEAALGASEKKISTASGKSFEVSVLILASGCCDRHGFIEGEEQFAGRGVFYNAYQDGPACDGQTLVVEGKNEQAIRETLYLSRFASRIHFVVPAMKLEAEAKLLDRVQKNEKIETMLSASLKKIEGEEKPQRAIVLSAGEEKQLAVDGVFLYARQSIPRYPFLKGTIEISEEGCVMVDETFMTSIPGVFACGDMVAGVPQLPFVSAAQGMVAALSADRWLANLEING